MPDEKKPDAETQCECCEEVINGEIYANAEFDAICMDCYAEITNCFCCDSPVASDDAEFWNSKTFCFNCADQHLVNCDSCGDSIYKRQQTHYDWDRDGECYCQSCANDVCAYQCDACGTDINVAEYIDNEGESYICDEEYCYNCWETRGTKVHLDESTSWGILKKCAFDDAYMKLVDNDDAARWVSQFYEYRLDDYDHQALLLQKGGLEKNKFGFWEGSIAVDSEINMKITRWVERIINDGSIKTSHKKYGEIRPFAELLQYYCRFEYRNEEGDYDSSFKRYVYGKPDLYVSIERHRDLARDIAENRIQTPTKSDDYKYINFKRAFNKLLKRYDFKLVQSWDGDRIYRWQTDWDKYLTNSVKINLPVKIGFDPSIMARIETHNGVTNACQNKSYRDTLAHSFVDMLVNPHLLLLIYNAAGEEIIGRSVVRTYYSGIDEDGKGGDIPLIAPSRLYLSQHTNVKNDICARMYDVLAEWGNHYYGKHELVVYNTSRHDQALSQYIENDKNIKLSASNTKGVLITDFWYPFFLERPSEDSFFTYYPDEQQTRSSYRIEQVDDGTYHQGYGVAEKTSSYRIISREVLNE